MNNRRAVKARQELLDRIALLRRQVREDIGIAALTISPTKATDRVVSGLLDGLNTLAAILSAGSRRNFRIGTHDAESHTDIRFPN
jgi:hypothetical protein